MNSALLTVKNVVRSRLNADLIILGVVKLAGKKAAKFIVLKNDTTGFIEIIRKINVKDVGSYQNTVVN